MQMGLLHAALILFGMQLLDYGQKWECKQQSNEVKGERKLIKIIDILGKTTTKHIKSNQILFYIYDDGSTEKIYSE